MKVATGNKFNYDNTAEQFAIKVKNYIAKTAVFLESLRLFTTHFIQPLNNLVINRYSSPFDFGKGYLLCKVSATGAK